MAVSPAGSGVVRVNGEIGPSYPWSPKSCDTAGEIHLEAVANSGYVFDHWSGNGLDGVKTNPIVTEIFMTKTITAHFIENTQLINQPPDADAGPDIEISEGDSATLDGTASTEPLGRPLLYEWMQVSPATPQIHFSEAGTARPSLIAPDITGDRSCFTIQLTVTDPEGQTDTDAVSVWVSAVNEPPVAILASDALAVASGDPVFLDGSQSYDPDGTIASGSWDVVSGNPDIHDALQGTIGSATGKTVAFTAPDIDGSIVIAFTVTDEDGRRSEPVHMTLTITGSGGIENQPPVADAGADQSVDEGDTVHLDGSGSSDPDGTLVAYKWDVFDGGGVELSGADGARAAFTAPQVDAETAWTFRLVVTDDKGASSFDTVVVSVADTPDGNRNGMPDELEANDGDADGDGINDFDDADSVCFRHINGENEYIRFYTNKGDLRDIRNLPDTDTSIPTAGKPDGTCPFGVISYRIDGLSTGETVEVVFVLPETVPEGLGFYKITETGWQPLDFAPGPEANEITITLTDGDPQTDEDGAANGVIEDPSAIMVSDPAGGGSGGSGDIDDVSSSGGGCFIKSLLE